MLSLENVPVSSTSLNRPFVLWLCLTTQNGTIHIVSYENSTSEVGQCRTRTSTCCLTEPSLSSMEAIFFSLTFNLCFPLLLQDHFPPTLKISRSFIATQLLLLVTINYQLLGAPFFRDDLSTSLTFHYHSCHHISQLHYPHG